MSTGIEWTDETWNPLAGCAHVSPGCDNCYAARETSGRLKGHPAYAGLAEGGKFTGEVRLLPERLEQPLRWRKPRRVFVNSMSDLFHQDVPDTFVAQVFAVMAVARQHTFQVLTKRPQRMAALLGDGDTFQAYVDECMSELAQRGAPFFSTAFVGWPLPNVWLGTSIESNRYAFRADHLRATPAAVRFISAEPLLGPLDDLDLTGIAWLIAGGESGPGARPMHPQWVRDLRSRCHDPFVNDSDEDPVDMCDDCGPEYDEPCARHRGPAFFFKQWGEWRYVVEAQTPGWDGTDRFPDHPWECLDLDGTHRGVDGVPNLTSATVQRVGKKRAGRELDGRTWDEYPAPVSDHRGL